MSLEKIDSTSTSAFFVQNLSTLSNDELSRLARMIAAEQKKRVTITIGKTRRYNLFPIKNAELHELYVKQRDNFWVPAEIDLETDIMEWRMVLTDDDRHFLSYTLSFFAQADGIVLDNLNQNFSLDSDIPEATLFYGIQAGIEAIHWETYALLIDTLIEDTEKQAQAHDAIANYPCIKMKADWIMEWMNPNVNSYPARIIAFACTEGIFFSSAFASIYYYKKRGLMPGLCHANRFIARDEGLHRDAGVEIFKILRRQGDTIPDQTVYDIVRSSVEIEKNFVDESLKVELIGIDSNKMKQYIELVADHLLTSLSLEKIYNVENPFDWMDVIGLSAKQNFFEGRVADYRKTSSKKEFNVEEEF